MHINFATDNVFIFAYEKKARRTRTALEFANKIQSAKIHVVRTQ